MSMALDFFVIFLVLFEPGNLDVLFSEIVGTKSILVVWFGCLDGLFFALFLRHILIRWSLAVLWDRRYV